MFPPSKCLYLIIGLKFKDYWPLCVKRNTIVMAARKQMGLNSGWDRRRLVVGRTRVTCDDRDGSWPVKLKKKFSPIRSRTSLWSWLRPVLFSSKLLPSVFRTHFRPPLCTTMHLQNLAVVRRRLVSAQLAWGYRYLIVDVSTLRELERPFLVQRALWVWGRYAITQETSFNNACITQKICIEPMNNCIIYAVQVRVAPASIRT